jgi:hypothetical protein
VAGVVTEGHLVGATVGAQFQGHEMDVKEKQCVAIKFCCKANISVSKTGALM